MRSPVRESPFPVRELTAGAALSGGLWFVWLTAPSPLRDSFPAYMAGNMVVPAVAAVIKGGLLHIGSLIAKLRSSPFPHSCQLHEEC